MKSSTTWILLQFLLVTAFQLLGCDALANHPKCYLVTSENERNPIYDVFSEVGKDVYVDCVNSASQANISHQMYWNVNQSTVPANQTQQISSNILSLHLKNATVDQSGYYSCSNSSQGICLTNIRIGYKPIRVTDFSCTSYNLKYMECRWTSPYNPVPVNYHYAVVYSRTSNLETVRFKPIRIKKSNKYFFNLTGETIPNYDMFKPTYIFDLYGSNRIGNDTWHFVIDHYKHVVPDRVTNVEAFALPDDLRTYKITYMKSDVLKHLSPGLLYRIEYQSQWNDSKTVIESNDTWVLLEVLPFTKYTLNVSCLSRTANKTLKSMWSKPTTFEFQTSPEAPGASPEIAPGSFHAKSFINHTDITLYWKSIPDYLKNGENLSYVVTARSINSGIGATLSTKQGYVTFTNLDQSDDYNFVLYSQNENGTFQGSSSIVVGAMTKLLPEPRGITVIAHNATHQYIEWSPPLKSVAGYRVFWTESNSAFATNEEGFLNWKDVDSNVTSTNVTLAGKLPYYNIGVTSIDGDKASGIIWNTCIVRSNGVIAKMKYVIASVPCSNSLNIQWNIDCADKKGIIKAYKVYYCPVAGENSSCIIGGPINVTSQNDNHAYSVTINNLTAYTWYRITVSVVSLVGEGEHSDPIFARTLESKPDYAVSDLRIFTVTNNSFVVKWHPPNITNGIITHYMVNYATSTESYIVIQNSSDLPQHEVTYTRTVTENVTPYTRYNVSIQACTSVGCSKPSDTKLVETEIGVPGQMSPPRVRLVNMTYAVISPETNGEINGPSLTWDIKAVFISSDNSSKEFIYSNLTEEMKYVRVDCDAAEWNGAMLEWQTRAINMKNSEVLVGDWSDYTKIGCLDPTIPIPLIIAIAIAAAVGLTILIFLAIAIAKQFKKTMEKVTVVLPQGLADEVEIMNYMSRMKTNKNNDYIKSDSINGADKMLLGNDLRSRNISGDTTQSSGSTEELLMQSKDHRLLYGNDSIGSGNHDSISSRPSTTQTQLSSESSLESVPSVPESPDSVFNEHPLMGVTVLPNMGINNFANNSGSNVFNPTLDRIAESNDGNSSQSGTPQHYSKFAGYYGSANNSPSNKRGGRVAQNGYVAAPYSKFGLGMMGESSNLGGPRADSPTSPFSLEINDTDPPLMSYSKVGLSIPLFPNQQQPSNDFQKGFAATSSPIAPVHSVTGYSVLGLGRANAGPEANTGPFSQPPPAAVSSPVEGTSKGYVLAAAMSNLASPSLGETSNNSTQQDCGTNSPIQSVSSSVVEGLESPNYTSMNAHKRSPSSASSLTAGYCRLALSRPTSMCSETDPNYVQTEPQTGSPVMTACHNGALDMVPGAVSPSQTAGGDSIMCSPAMHMAPVHTATVGGNSGLNGYATVQQLLKEKGNS